MQFRYPTSLSLNEEEYKQFKASKKGIKEIFLIGLGNVTAQVKKVPLEVSND